MNTIYTITDKDFQIAEITHNSAPLTRYGARGIVFGADGKIALINKIAKNEFKLPGGGVDDGEDFEEAFIRECREEIGAGIEIIDNLGRIIEYKSQENFRQISKVFVAKIIENLPDNNLTTKEIEEGVRVVFEDIDTALQLMKESLENLKDSKYDNIYRSRFMVLRDIKIIEYYLSRQAQQS